MKHISQTYTGPEIQLQRICSMGYLHKWVTTGENMFFFGIVLTSTNKGLLSDYVVYISHYFSNEVYLHILTKSSGSIKYNMIQQSKNYVYTNTCMEMAMTRCTSET